MKLNARSLGLTLAFGAAWGCVSVGAPEDAPPAPPPGPAQAAEAPEAGGPSFTLMEFAPMRAETRKFMAIEGERRGRELDTSFESLGPDAWVWRLKGVRDVYLKLDAQGDLVTMREDEFSERVSVRYEPGIPLAPGRLTQQGPGPRTLREGAVKVTVLHATTGRSMDSGECSYRLEWLPTPGEAPSLAEMQTVRLRGWRELSLGLANCKVEVESTYRRGVGLVRERVVQRTRALGLIETSKTEVIQIINEDVQP